MTSDDEVTSFFGRVARPVANGSAARPRKRRKSSYGGTADDSSSADESSSDVEIVGSSAAKKRSAAKGKGKGQAMAPQPLHRAKQVDKPSRRAKEVSLLSSDTDSSVSDELPSATQIDAHGAALLAMARSKGYAGTTSPRRAKPQQEERVEASNRTNRREQDDSDSSLSDDSRRRRRKSNSTELTTVSDRSSSATKTKASTSAARSRKAAPAKRTTKATSTSRRKNAASPSRSPSPQLEQPPEPDSFWQVEAQPAQGRGAKRQKHGEASSKLKALSERSKMLVLPDDEEEDEIVGSSSSASEGPRRYETVAAKAKREKEEAIAALKAKRGRQSLPLQDAPNGAAPAASPHPKDKGKGKAVPEPTGQCPVCSEEIPLGEIEAHASACLAIFEDVSDTQQQAPPPGCAAQLAAPHTGTFSAFRPAGSGAPAASFSRAQAARLPPAAKAGPPAGDNTLANELFPSSPPIQRTTRAAVTSKGKGRAATLVEDSDEDAGRSGRRAGGYQGRQQYNAPFDGADDGYIDSDAYVDADTSLHKTVVELSDDDDIVIADVSRSAVTGPNRARGGARGGSDGREGAVNSVRAKGPPENGSSPPKGSIYVSTLGRAYREGYENLFTTATKAKSGSRALPGLGNNDVDDTDARAFDALAPPAKSTGRGRGGGGRKASGGGRKSSWGSWRGRRGRGRK